MKKVALATLLIAIQAFAHAEWTWIGKATRQNVSEYIDISTLRTTGKTVKIWGHAEYNEPQKREFSAKTFRSVRELKEFSCDNEESRTLSIVFYEEIWGHGDIIYSDLNPNTPGNWQATLPESTGKARLSIVCNLQNLIERRGSWEDVIKENVYTIKIEIPKKLGAENSVTIRELTDWKSDTKSQITNQLQYKSSISNVEFACNSKAARTLSLTTYSLNGAQGDVVTISQFNGPFESIVGYDFREAEYKLVCERMARTQLPASEDKLKNNSAKPKASSPRP
ncbi:MAG: surface-adhesin E family protein [Leptothrix sp. (in: b-proteobacteria)]